METFDFAHGVADRMDDGTYKDVIPVLDRQSKCRRVSRSQIDCGFNISLWPWSFDGGDPIECRSVIRTRAARSYGEVLYSSRAVGKPRCHFI
jgi:hypothetical protein